LCAFLPQCRIRGCPLFNFRCCALYCHSRTVPLIDVKPPVASCDRCFFPRPETFEALYAAPVGKWTISALRKNRALAEHFFLTICSPMRRFDVETCVPFRYSFLNQITLTAAAAGSATSPLLRFARCARVIPRSRSTSGLAHLGKGPFRPRCIPRPGLSARGPDRGDFIPRTHDHGSLRARPGPPDRGRLRSPSGHPSTRLSQPWTAPKGVAPWHRRLPLLSAHRPRGCKPAVNPT